MSRDDHYRNSCVFPKEYDDLIDRIKVLNPYCRDRKTEEEREEFACRAVHSCISAVLYGDAGSYSATGGALAVRGSSNSNSGDYKKVILAFR
jgi:hypothetical protein